MHFKYSNAEHTYIEDGKSRTYKICDICGTEQQNNYGLEVSYARSGEFGSWRMGLCGKCANKILPILEGALGEIRATANTLRNDTQKNSLHGKKRKAKGERKCLEE